jgi:PKD repeat protein
MTWSEISPIAAALDRATSDITATFQGRDQLRPVAGFTARREINELLVDFTDTSTSTVSTIASWAWNFGDGNTSTSQNPSHTYAAGGDYLVVLVVTDAAGRIDEYMELVPTEELIGDPGEDPEQPGVFPGPTAKFTYVDNGSQQVTFTDASTEGIPASTIVDWEWDFGETPTADFSFSFTNLVGTFTDASSDNDGTIASRVWDFGDGTTSTSTNPAKTYAATGSYNVSLTVTDDDGLTGTVSKTVAVQAATPPANTIGIPFGAFNLYTSPTAFESGGTAELNLDHSFVSSANFVTRLQNAATRGVKLILTIPGSSHSPWITNGLFDLVKWKAGVDAFATPANKTALETALLNGTVLGNSVMDEPNFADWGPKGTITKATLDEMAAYVRTKMQTTTYFPQGVVVVHWWREGSSSNTATQPRETYQVIDFIVDQYDWWQSPNGPGGGQSGNYTGWRTAALTAAARNGISIAFSMNILNGGIQDITEPIVQNCPTTGDPLLVQTGGNGTRSPCCRYSPTQLETWGKHFGEAGGFLLMWRYDTQFFVTGSFNVDNQIAMGAIADHLATKPRKSLRRP